MGRRRKEPDSIDILSLMFGIAAGFIAGAIQLAIIIINWIAETVIRIAEYFDRKKQIKKEIKNLEEKNKSNNEKTKEPTEKQKLYKKQDKNIKKKDIEKQTKEDNYTSYTKDDIVYDSLEDWQKKEVDNGGYDSTSFEEEDLEEDDYYFEDED